MNDSGHSPGQIGGQIPGQWQVPKDPKQILEPAAYTSPEWFAAEQKNLFGKSWVFAGVLSDLAKPGDFTTAQAGHYPLAAVRGRDGELRGFHNICRHRGAEILERAGNMGGAFVCPYHEWTYDLAGKLKGIPEEADCFPGLDRSGLNLHDAGLAVFKDMVFLHPDPGADFQAWLGGLDQIAWPHDISTLVETRDVTYEMNCNWKIFYENAIDGYHLKYLHKKTFGGPAPAGNDFVPRGKHLVWYSTEIPGRNMAFPKKVAERLKSDDRPMIPGSESADYGGVYMLFPTTIALPNPYNFSVSQLIPLAADKTLIRSRVWGLPGGTGRASQNIAASERARDPHSGHVRLDLLDVHPTDSLDHQLEDMWICEKLQRAMHSPKFKVGPLAKGGGGEATLEIFQNIVRNYVEGTGA